MTPPLVKRYLVALDRHKWAGLAGFLVVLGLSGVAALQPEPPVSHVAEGVLTYSSPPVTFSTTGTALQQQGQALTGRMLLSDYVVGYAEEQLTAQQVELSREEIRQNAIVQVNPEEEGEDAVFQVLVSYQSSDKELAEQTANLLMEAMVEQSRLFNTQQLSNVIDNLNQLLGEVSGDLRTAEQNLERYVREEGPAIQAAQDGALIGGITGSQQQQRQIRLTLQGIDAQIRSLQGRLGLSPDQAYASSALSADPIIANLRTLIYQNETQMSILSQRLRAEHPDMVALRNQQQAYDQLLRQRVAEVIGGNNIAAPLPTSQIRQDSSLDPARQQLANTLVGLQTQRDTLQQQLAAVTASEQELRQEYTSIPNKQLEQARLQQEVALTKSFYDQIQARLEDATIAEKETVGNLVIAQPAQPGLVEDQGRNSVVILAVGAFVGLLVGGGLVLLLDSLDATFHTLQDLQASLRQQEVPILGLLPAIPDEGDGLPLVVNANSPYIEPYERFRGNLRRAAGGRALKMVLLTSTLNGEGKTVSAYNLAIASARAGKRTLLIEADLRSPSQAKSLKVVPDPESVVEPLRYYGHLSDCIRLVPEIENLYILPSPGAQSQAAAILESTEMRRVLEDVRGRFDLVILDTPALSRYNDALLLEPYADGMVLVTRPGYTEDGVLAEAIEQFMDSDDVRFLGAIINGADIPVQMPQTPSDLDGQFVVEDMENQEDFERVGSRSREL
ncbi:AAA family ATPase [Oculatella sp. FACHB-28]|uniref:GumC family protein n=1 Tax=Cyanophyceae TaxID=3028117 RepID=UPI0016843C6C|nr:MULTISPECIES: tyrosine-protein kinase domain-containing protein [Cyanophyceae]MBD1866905.1 AAA family ATPase [Cyanobacteria bacterium FACHB-471]MBD2058935.1 AAA family ATPase [Oculatella sp. FACHB-28]MBD2070986.1 AAA family ATPase [Leptolyngbya sp. FACHB-671]